MIEQKCAFVEHDFLMFAHLDGLSLGLEALDVLIQRLLAGDLLLGLVQPRVERVQALVGESILLLNCLLQ